MVEAFITCYVPARGRTYHIIWKSSWGWMLTLLCRWFHCKTTPQLWLNMERNHNLDMKNNFPPIIVTRKRKLGITADIFVILTDHFLQCFYSPETSPHT